jgi:hypothetical protein
MVWIALRPNGGVDLLAQVADVDLDDVEVALEREVPYVLDDLRLRQHLARPRHEELEQGELPWGELDLLVTPPAPVLGRIETEVTRGQDRRSLPPARRMSAREVGEEHHEGEGFVRKSSAPVSRASAWSRSPSWPSASGWASRCPRPAGRSRSGSRSGPEHEIEDDGVVVVLARHPQALIAVEREVDREPFLLQAVAHGLRQPLLVLDDQDPHAAMLDRDAPWLRHVEAPLTCPASRRYLSSR